MSQMQEQHEVELIDYIEVILKRKWLVIGFTVICGLVMGINTLLGNRQYQAESLVVVSQAIATESTGGGRDYRTGACGTNI